MTLPPEVKRWLEVQALGRDCTVSDLVARLVADQPPGWTLSRPRRSGEEPPADGPALAIVREAV